MKKVWAFVGRVMFWLVWPITWLTLKLTTRSRLLIVNGHDVLLLKNWLGDGKWCMPGGGLHRGEDPAVGVIREVKEELGLEVSLSQIDLLGETQVSKYGLRFKYFVSVCLLPERPAVKTRRLEIVEMAWLPWDSVAELNADPSVKLALAAWQRKA